MWPNFRACRDFTYRVFMKCHSPPPLKYETMMTSYTRLTVLTSLTIWRSRSFFCEIVILWIWTSRLTIFESWLPPQFRLPKCRNSSAKSMTLVPLYLTIFMSPQIENVEGLSHLTSLQIHWIQWFRDIDTSPSKNFNHPFRLSITPFQIIWHPLLWAW